MKSFQNELNDIGKIEFVNRPKNSYFSTSKFVKELTPKDFEGNNLKDKRCHFIMFYLPGCGWCKQLSPVWEQLGETAAFFEIGAVNSEKYRSLIEQLNQGKDHITKYPSLLIFKNGEMITPKYQGDRDLASLVKWCVEMCQ